jgi:hypothetical protein
MSEVKFGSVEWELHTRHTRIGVAMMRRICWFIGKFTEQKGRGPWGAEIDVFVSPGRRTFMSNHRQSLLKEKLIEAAGKNKKARVYLLSERGAELVAGWTPEDWLNRKKNKQQMGCEEEHEQ